MGNNIGQKSFDFMEGMAAKAGIGLADRYVAPPFTILDARQGYWQQRKQQWIESGIKGEQGREMLGSTVASGWVDRGAGAGGSIFDPVLCEVVYRWFCPEGGAIFDPFAGEATKGIVAACLDYRYTGIELRQAQVDANKEQWQAMGINGNGPVWLCGDAAKTLELLTPGDMFDLVFTSPPYYDLEEYEGGDTDMSMAPSYFSFMLWYEVVFRQAVSRLRNNRFLVVKVGEIRDNKGVYRNFVGDNVQCFTKLGLKYYNEAILITPTGSLPIRAANQFAAGRKLGKGHQNILVFYKGDPEKIKDVFGVGNNNDGAAG